MGGKSSEYDNILFDINNGGTELQIYKVIAFVDTKAYYNFVELYDLNRPPRKIVDYTDIYLGNATVVHLQKIKSIGGTGDAEEDIKTFFKKIAKCATTDIIGTYKILAWAKYRDHYIEVIASYRRGAGRRTLDGGDDFGMEMTTADIGYLPSKKEMLSNMNHYRAEKQPKV